MSSALSSAAIVAKIAPVAANIPPVVTDVAPIGSAVTAVAAKVMPQVARTPAIDAVAGIRTSQFTAVRMNVAPIGSAVTAVAANIARVTSDLFAVAMHPRGWEPAAGVRRGRPRADR